MDQVSLAVDLFGVGSTLSRDQASSSESRLGSKGGIMQAHDSARRCVSSCGCCREATGGETKGVKLREDGSKEGAKGEREIRVTDGEILLRGCYREGIGRSCCSFVSRLRLDLRTCKRRRFNFYQTIVATQPSRLWLQQTSNSSHSSYTHKRL